MNKRRVGSEQEKLAVQFLKEQGIRILETNYTCRLGEIDIIANDGIYFLFLEVKYRKTGHAGLPEEAVDYRKQQKICRVADFYRYSHKLPANAQIRFDVIAILDEKISWHKNAFYYRGSM